MAEKNLKVALQIKADLDQAKREVGNLRDELVETSKAADTATTSQSKTSKAVAITAEEIKRMSGATDLKDGIKQMSDYEIWLGKTSVASKNVAESNKLIESSIKSLTPQLMSLIGLSGGFIAVAVDTVNKAANLKNLSSVTGMDVEQFQYYIAGAKKVGVEQDKLADIFKDTQDKVGDFLSTGGGEMADFFEKIAPKVGVTADQFKKLNGKDALQLYVDSLQKAGVSQNEMVFYLEAIANDATLLLPLLNNGGEAWKKYGDAAQAAGAILSTNTVEQAVKAKNAIGDFQQSVTGVTNTLVANAAPAIVFVAEHMDDLVRAGLIVASLFAGRMVTSTAATTIAFIAGRIEAVKYQMALANMSGIATTTAARLTALSTASRLLTLAGGLPGLAIAAAGVIASFLLMPDATDEATTSLDTQNKSVEELRQEYEALEATQQRVLQREQAKKVDELSDAFRKQSVDLAGLVRVIKSHSDVSSADKKIVEQLYAQYIDGKLSADQLATALNKLGSVNQELKTRLDDQAKSTIKAKGELDKANTVLGVYQGTTKTASTASNDLSKNVDGVGNSADNTKSKIQGLSKAFEDYINKTRQGIFSNTMQTELMKRGYSESLSKAITDARVAKGSDLTRSDIQLIFAQQQAQEKLNNITEQRKKSEQETTKELKKQADETKRLVGLVGSTGTSTGNHLDIRYDRSYSNSAVSAEHLARFQLGGKTLDAKNSNSPYGMRTHPVTGEKKLHRGYDFAAPAGTEVTTSYPIKDVKTFFDKNGGGYVSQVIFEDGVVVSLLHQIPEMKGRIKGGSSKGKSQSEISNEQYDIFLAQEQANKQQQDDQIAIRKSQFTDQEKLEYEHQENIKAIRSAGFGDDELKIRLDSENTRYQEVLTKRVEIFKQAKDDIANIDQSWLRSTGRGLDADLVDVEEKWKPVLENLDKAISLESDPSQRAELMDYKIKIGAVIDKEQLTLRFNEAQKQLDDLQSLREQRQETLKLKYDSGQISQPQYAEGLQTIDSELLPGIQAAADHAKSLAESMGDALNVERLNAFIVGLTQVDTEFKKFLPTADQLNESIAGGLTDAIMDFADGTKSASDAFRQFASDFLKEIAQMILKQMMFNAVKGIMGSSGGVGGAIASGISAAFANGGYTGDGGKYEPAGIVHKGEVVFSQEDVKRWGGVSVVEAMRTFKGFADGGVVGVPNVQIPHIQAPKLNDPVAQIASSTSFSANQQFLLVDDPSRLSDYIKSGEGQETLVVMMSRDPAKFKAALKIG